MSGYEYGKGDMGGRYDRGMAQEYRGTRETGVDRCDNTMSACDLDRDDSLRVGSGDAEECFSFDPHPQAVTWADARE